MKESKGLKRGGGYIVVWLRLINLEVNKNEDLKTDLVKIRYIPNN